MIWAVSGYRVAGCWLWPPKPNERSSKPATTPKACISCNRQQVPSTSCWPISKSVDHHIQCRLGRWYFEGRGREHYARYSSFQTIDRPHQSVHDSGRQALELAANQDSAGLKKALDSMEKSSVSVMESMNNLLLEIDRGDKSERSARLAAL
ncbi:CZB domain-containing protein [Pistricoccus aurantiacus]|uniref:CZB domain-containing protein n=1 Tax=Pistricoccus aurantiacus TaxID=1883414 RepID=UPI003626077C